MGRQIRGRWVSIGGLLCVLLAMATPAWATIDANEPAEFIVLVQDEQKKPIEGVDVAILLRETPQSKAVTDANGIAVLQMVCPGAAAGHLFWQVQLRCTKQGLWETNDYASPFSGARVPVTMTMRPAVTTRIRLLGPQGRPVTGAPIWIEHDSPVSIENDFPAYPPRRDLSQHLPTTDGEGVFLCKHPRLDGPGRINVGSLSFPLTNEPEVTLRLEEWQLTQFAPRTRLQGRLLDANGLPARGSAVVRAWYRYAFVIADNPATGDASLWYSADPLTRVDDDGRFTLELGDHDLLAVTSPEGVSFLHDLTLSGWPQTRNVTLHLPPVRRVHKVQLLWQDGNAAAGVILNARLPNHAYLDIPRSDSNTFCICTDADGRLEAPIYFGGSTWFEPKNANLPWDLLEHEMSIARPKTPYSWSPEASWGPRKPTTRRIFLKLQDANGRDIDPAGVKPPWDAQNNCTLFPDTRGLAVFTDANADAIHPRLEIAGWGEIALDISLAVPDDHVTAVSLPARPGIAIHGKVLDADGGMIKAARICSYEVVPLSSHPYIPVKPYPRSWPRPAEVQPDGSFVLQDPRLESTLDIDPNAASLPGWVDEVPWDTNTHDVVLQLRRGGRVKVLLPQGAQHACTFYLRYAGQRVRDASWLHPPASDEGNAIVYPHVAPGAWELSVTESSALRFGGAFSMQSQPSRMDARLPDEHTLMRRLEIKEGVETVIDLRKRNAGELVPQHHTVRFTAAGKPVSGADVRVYATWATDANLFVYLKYLANESYDVREQAEAILRNAGKAGVGAILAGRAEDPEARVRIEGLMAARHDGLNPNDIQDNPSPDPWHAATPIQADITGDDGTAAFALYSGRRYIAVARLPGKWIGLTAFVTPAKPGPPFEIAAWRARSLEIKPRDGGSLAGRRAIFLVRNDDFAPDEAMALMNALGGCPVNVTSELQPWSNALEDLPAGRRYHLSWRAAKMEEWVTQDVDLTDNGGIVQPLPLNVPAAIPTEEANR